MWAWHRIERIQAEAEEMKAEDERKREIADAALTGADRAAGITRDELLELLGADSQLPEPATPRKPSPRATARTPPPPRLPRSPRTGSRSSSSR